MEIYIDLAGDEFMEARNESEDYRKRKRFEIEQNILCYKHIKTKTDKMPSRAPFKIKILNVSYSGVKLRTKRELHMGDVLIFNLQSGNRVKQFMLEVVWSKYDGEFFAGLRFINLTKDMIMFLNEMILDFVEKEKRLKKYQ